MKKCLTIDLDYWTNCYRTPRFWGKQWVEDFMSRSKRNVLIDEHHEILDHLDDSFDEVVNVDFHNDIVRGSVSELNEGTWANFMPQSIQKFTWYYPSKKKCIDQGFGVCLNIDGASKDDGFPIEYEQIRDCINLPFQSFDLIVVCKSLLWDENDTLDYYLRAVEKHL